MAWIPDRYRELGSLVRGDRVKNDIAEELEHHIEMRTEENMEAGMSREDARAEAMRRFGDLERIRRETEEIDERLERRRRRRDLVGALLRESRLAIRVLLRRPGFTAVALLTLILGIGAVSAIFTVLNGVVLSPLPYPQAEELVWLESRVPGVAPNAVWGLSEAGYFHFQEENRSFAGLGAYRSTSLNLASDNGAARVRAALVSADLLDVLRATPAVGRLIEEADDTPDQPTLAVLGYSFWQRELGGDPDVVGTTVILNAIPHEVIGVMGEGIELPDQRIDVWLPLGMDPARPPVNWHWVQAIARLEPETSPAAAQADVARLTAQFTELFPSAYPESFVRESGFSTSVVPLHTHVVGDVSSALWLLFGAVGLVLLIAGANVTNLFLVRTEGRRRELAIRSALGAEKTHLAWHYLSESLLLCLGAAAGALLLAHGAVKLLLHLAPPGLPRLAELGLGGDAIAFTVLIAIAVGVVLGLVPLVYRLVNYDALREGGRGLTPSPGRNFTRRVIVVAQVAIALVLLTAAGLMLRSFNQLRHVDPGLDPQGVLTMDLTLPYSSYQSYEDVNRFYHDLLVRIEALPGVTEAAATQRLPLADVGGCAAIFIQDDPPEPDEQPPCVGTAQVTPGFFDALGIPVRGEVPTWSDMERRSGGVVVTRALADRLWPGVDALGKGIRGNGWGEPFYRVVGVADDFRSDGLDRPPLQAVFFPMLPLEGANLWSPPHSMSLAVKTTLARPEELTGAIRRVLADLDATVPLASVRTMEEVVERSPTVARASFTMLLLGIAGGMALLLSGVGLYGVIAYSVGQRRTEIGVRVAVGAGAGEVVRMVVRRSLMLSIIGVALGLVAALAVTRVMRSLLFGVTPTDPLALVAAAVLLVLLSLVASLVPARRAVSVDPVEALRVE